MEERGDRVFWTYRASAAVAVDFDASFGGMSKGTEEE
jgi:hypothetical protein